MLIGLVNKKDIKKKSFQQTQDHDQLQMPRKEHIETHDHSEKVIANDIPIVRKSN
jgi:hypothetical protein